MSWNLLDAVPSGEGVKLRLKIGANAWQKGRLVERIQDSKNFEWKVLFEDGTIRDDIRLGDNRLFTVFEQSAYGEEVQIFCTDEAWHDGILVTLIKGDGVYGVEFQDGDWVEDITLFSSYLRFKDGGKEEERERQWKQAKNNARKEDELRSKEAKDKRSKKSELRSGAAFKTAKDKPSKKSALRSKEAKDKRSKKSALRSGAEFKAVKDKPRKKSALPRDFYKEEVEAKREHVAEDERMYDIGCVRGSKVFHGVHCLKIHWAGWGSEVDSWEPFSQLARDCGTKFVKDLVALYQQNA
jgi:hypothetical protein